MTTHAEGLTRRAPNDNLGLGKREISVKFDLIAVAVQVMTVSCAAIGIHLKAQGSEALSLKTQRQAATTRKQIQDKRITFRRGAQNSVDFFREVHHKPSLNHFFQLPVFQANVFSDITPQKLVEVAFVTFSAAVSLLR
jgi:hypothetical protein